MRMKDSSQTLTAYEEIQKSIISYTLPPETPISDNKLAKSLNMSRAPVREAILLLQMDGLVQTNEAGKMIVSPIQLDDVVDILRVRGALETEALRIIETNGWLTPEQELELTMIHSKMCSNASPDQVYEHYRYDDLFHQKLVEFSQSPRICDLLDRMRLQMQRARWLNIANQKRQIDATKEHGELLSAVMNHDLDKAIKLLRIHFANSEECFRVILKDRQMQTLASMINNFFA